MKQAMRDKRRNRNRLISPQPCDAPTVVSKINPRCRSRHFSRKYYNSPMPHSIFFYYGFAIHGTNDIARLGGPASHGCVRLHPSHAAALLGLVQRNGPASTAWPAPWNASSAM